MPEEPAPDGDVATALVRQLETDAELIDVGGFTLDFARARDKLAERRLVNPQAFVLLLVEAAHLLPGCTAISFSIRRRSTRVRLAGVRLSGHELRTIFDAIVSDPSRLEPAAARRELGRQRLAVAIDTALAQPEGRSVDLRAHASDREPVELCFDSEGMKVVASQAQRGSPSLSLSLCFARAAHVGVGAAKKQRALLRDRCRYAELPVDLDDARLDVQTPLCDVTEPVELRTEAGELVGKAGWSPARTDAKVFLVANGVIIERLRGKGWLPGFVALVEAGDLRRDLSLSKLVRDESFAKRLDLVRRCHAALQTPDVAAVTHAPGSPSLPGTPMVAGLVALVAMPATVLLAVLFSSHLSSILIVNLVALVTAGQVIRVVRAEALRARGHPAIGEVRSVNVVWGRDTSHRRLQLALRVAAPDRFPYEATTQIELSKREGWRLRPGERFYVRVDPNDPQRVVIDPKH